MITTQWNLFDAAILIVLIISALLAWFRGFVHEVLSMAGYVGAAATAVYGLPYAQPYFRNQFKYERVADAAAVAALGFASLVILSIIIGLITSRVKKSNFSYYDRTLGAAFGLVRGIVLLALALMAVRIVIPTEILKDVQETSKLLFVVDDTIETVNNAIPEQVKKDLMQIVKGKVQEALDKDKNAEGKEPSKEGKTEDESNANHPAAASSDEKTGNDTNDNLNKLYKLLNQPAPTATPKDAKEGKSGKDAAASGKSIEVIDMNQALKAVGSLGSLLEKAAQESDTVRPANSPAGKGKEASPSYNNQQQGDLDALINKSGVQGEELISPPPQSTKRGGKSLD